MQNLSLLARYQQALHQSGFQPDEIQHKAVICLERIQQAIISRQATAAAVTSGWRGWLKGLMGESTSDKRPSVQGLYMWGGVGRGKTWLMDLFFQSIPGERKLRLHFHRFMLRVHEELTALQGQADPLLIIADRFKAETDLLCFDEFFVSDITDAMLLGTLMEALFERDITLIATSNTPPDELYRNGLQRARFLPAIDQIKAYCEVMNVDAGIDYRLRTLTAERLWIVSHNKQTIYEMDRMFTALAGETRTNKPVLDINYRQLPSEGEANGVLMIKFHILCGEGRSQDDYIELSRRYHSVLLLDVPVMKANREDEARRFLALVDEFYERHVKLAVSAEARLFDIYQGDRLKFEYQRCLSRLQEMQSKAYLSLPHLA